MKLVARHAACAVAVLIGSTSTAFADPSGCQWDDDGNCWMFTPIEMGSHTRQVEYRDVGIVLSITPIVGEGHGPAEPLFVLWSGAIYVDVGTDRHPRWERISEREFSGLIAELEKAGFGFVAEVVDEELIVQMVLIL